MRIGVDLGGSHIAIGVVNDDCFIVEKVEKRILTEEKADIKNCVESYIINNVISFVVSMMLLKLVLLFLGL